MKSPITTHVLDTTHGRPAKGVAVVLEMLDAIGKWQQLATGLTNNDGRVGDLLAADHVIEKGVYRLTFQTQGYFKALNVESFYPQIPVIFEICEPQQHYHVPLLLSPFGYSTYRGS